MKVEFATMGSSLAVPIPSSLAEQIGAAPGKIADITVRNGDLVISIEAKLGPTLREMVPPIGDDIEFEPPRMSGDIFRPADLL